MRPSTEPEMVLEKENAHEACESPAVRRIVVGVTSGQTCLVLNGRLRALREAGFSVTLVAAPGTLLEACAKAEGVEAVPVPMERDVTPLQDLVSFVRLVRLLRRVRPEITDFSTPKAGFLGNVAAWLVGVPHRVYTLRGLKLQGARGWKRGLLLWAERMSARCAQVVLCNSVSLQEEARALGIAPGEKLRLLGDGSSNGVDLVRFSPGRSPVRERLGIGAEEPVVGFVGRLTRDKGIPELVAAFEMVLKREPQAWLLLVGWMDAAEDALPDALRRRILSHPRMIYTGYVENVEAYYRAMDVMVLPTHREGFPNAVLEASACGVPVVTTDSTGARDAVVPEVTGFVVPPRNTEAIAGIVSKLLEDAALRKRIGCAGRLFAAEKYTQKRVLGLVVDFFQGLGTRS
jgi:glycosyltransferase involved in cell wall biosynthesis